MLKGIVHQFLASPDALEVVLVTDSLTDSLMDSPLDWREWWYPLKTSIAQCYISLLSGMWNIDIDDQHRNTNMNNEDHLVGQLTYWRLDQSFGGYLGNGTSDHRNKKTKTLCNTKYPPKPRETHLRNHAIATYKTYVFSRSPNGPILTKKLVTGEVMVLPELLSDLPVLLIFVGVGSRA